MPRVICPQKLNIEIRKTEKFDNYWEGGSLWSGKQGANLLSAIIDN